MIIKSIIDTDQYKKTMGQGVLMRYPQIGASYRFINRGHTQFPRGFEGKANKEIENMSKLRLTKKEKSFLETIPYFKKDFINWFADFQFDPSQVYLRQSGGELLCDISGPWHQTIYWEVPLLALISEVYFKETGQKPNMAYLYRITKMKAEILRNSQARYTDFGTRRRFSFDIQKKVLDISVKTAGKIQDGGVFMGTSNTYLAMILGLKAFGTVAHEWFQAHAAIFGYERATTEALKAWNEEFGGALAIALSDTFTTDEFLRNFDTYFAQLFDGVRQDSGDPLVVLEKVIKHYESLGIDPKSKIFVASDNLNVDKVLEIQEACRNRIQCSFGIGTNLTNDVGNNVKPLNMVIKLREVTFPDGRTKKVVKLSDDEGKITGDPEEVKNAKRILFGKT